MRRAFTLIEVIVSVIIIATSMIFVLRIHSQSRNQAHYIRHRIVAAFEDSLFLTDKTQSMHQDTRDAYTLHMRMHRIMHDDTVKHLKRIERNITSLDVPLPSDDALPPIPVRIIQTFLQAQHKSGYYRISL